MKSEGSPIVIEHLIREQANATRLYLRYKGYHWNVAGPTFRDLHLLFDEHAAGVLDTVDALAERQLMLGAGAGFSLEFLRRHSSLGEDADLPSTPREMIESLLDGHRRIIEGMKLGFRAADEEGDPGSADLFARFLQVHEKMAWFLRKALGGSSTLLADTRVDVRIGVMKEARPVVAAPARA